MKTLLEKLRALAETEKQATAGPWEHLSGGSLLSPLHRIIAGARVLFFREHTYAKVEQDAALIADSRTLLKALLASWFAQHEALKLMVNGTHCDDHCEECQDDGVKCIHEVAREALNLATTPHP